jgi:uncharacterized membrane protein YhiD involved in acid resistance
MVAQPVDLLRKNEPRTGFTTAAGIYAKVCVLKLAIFLGLHFTAVFGTWTESFTLNIVFHSHGDVMTVGLSINNRPVY